MTAQEITRLAGHPDSSYLALSPYILRSDSNADGEDCIEDTPLKTQILNDLYGPWWVSHVLDKLDDDELLDQEDEPWMEEEE
jgi:hypothetical protein